MGKKSNRNSIPDTQSQMNVQEMILDDFKMQIYPRLYPQLTLDRVYRKIIAERKSLQESNKQFSAYNQIDKLMENQAIKKIAYQRKMNQRYDASIPYYTPKQGFWTDFFKHYRQRKLASTQKQIQNNQFQTQQNNFKVQAKSKTITKKNK